ncbi:MAG: MFS transporter, partial [Ferruginibacter sp.]
MRTREFNNWKILKIKSVTQKKNENKLLGNFYTQLQTLGTNFSPLRIRNMRIYMIGQSVNLLGDWMQQTAQVWIVWELTHEITALGIVGFLSQIPFFIFGPWVGIVSDKYDRRKILLITQILSMLFAFLLAFLIQTNRLVIAHVYIVAFLLGTATRRQRTLMTSARITFILAIGKVHQAPFF